MPEKRKYTPQVENAINEARKVAPDLAPVEMYGTVSRMVSPTAQGYLSPGGTIYLNPDNLGSTTDIIDTLIHENTHARQRQSRGGSTLKELWRQMTGSDGNLPYGQRPDEMEAFQEANAWRRSARQPAGSVPSFSNPGQYYTPQDVNLPNEKKKR